MEGNCLTLVTEKPVRKGILMDLLMLTNKKDLVEDVKVGCSDQ